ncbi:hypothetical protein [Flexivirga sp. B27]
MVDNKRSAAHSGPARRSVVASAWAAPVILTAAAAPAASASTAGFDIALDPPQMGDSITAYNGDFTHIYSISGIMAWVVANHGSAVAPGGFPMSLTCDNRIWEVASVKGGLDNKLKNLPITKRVSDGNSTTVTFLIPDDIPPNTDSYSGFWVIVDNEFKAVYPNDGVTAPTGTRWEVMPPAGDADASNNVVAYAGFEDKGPADIWGVVATRLAQETVKWTDGTTLRRPTRVEMKSVGPKPTLGGAGVHVSTDARMSRDIEVRNVTVDGVATSILGPGESSVWQDVSLGVTFPLTRPLAGGEVLRFDVVYVDDEQELYGETHPGQTSFLPADEDLNTPNQRARERAYFNN